MLSEIQKIDVLSTTPSGDKRLIIVVEHGEWDYPNRLQLLQDKLNNYAAFALDGEMYRKFAGSEGAKVTIVVASFELPQDVADFIGQVQPIFGREGVAVEIETIPGEEAA